MTDKTRIMFVCLGNICRSPMAECVMKHIVKEHGSSDGFIINSSATSNEEEGNGIYYPAVEKLKQSGIEIVEHRAVQLSRYDAGDYDYFIGMEERNLTAMRRILGSDTAGKILKLLDYTLVPRDIADPWWTGNFDKTYGEIYEGCNALFEHVMRFGNVVRPE